MTHPSQTTPTTLYDLAHARTGDKGDSINISLIAYDPADYEALVRKVTEERVARHFAYRSPAAVRRYLLPRLCAMNFVLDRALDGGVNSSLNLDMHGKALSFHLLDMPMPMPIATEQTNPKETP